MRGPRYKFPDEVRSTTRALAARTVKEDTVPGTPEGLHERIVESPEVRESLERGGYGSEFTASDLFPLYEAMVTQAGGTVVRPVVAPPPDPPARGRGVLLGVVLVALVLLALAIALL